MQPALQIQTQVNQSLVDAIPALKPLLGHRIQVIALDLEQDNANKTTQKISFEEFLQHRLKRPENLPSVSLDEMEKAIAQGALNGNF